MPDIGMIVILAVMVFLVLWVFSPLVPSDWETCLLLSPFVTLVFLFSVAAGILILGEQVNAIMLFGSGLTILSGLYIWRREIVIQKLIYDVLFRTGSAMYGHASSSAAHPPVLSQRWLGKALSNLAMVHDFWGVGS